MTYLNTAPPPGPPAAPLRVPGGGAMAKSVSTPEGFGGGAARGAGLPVDLMSSIRSAGGVSALRAVRDADESSTSPAADGGAADDDGGDSLAAALKAALSRRNNAIAGEDSDEEDADGGDDDEWDD